jgi:hypothetical protein
MQPAALHDGAAIHTVNAPVVAGSAVGRFRV